MLICNLLLKKVDFGFKNGKNAEEVDEKMPKTIISELQPNIGSSGASEGRGGGISLQPNIQEFDESVFPVRALRIFDSFRKRKVTQF